MFDYVLKNTEGATCKVGDIILLAGQYYLVSADTYSYENPDFVGSKSVVLVECNIGMSGEVTISNITKLVSRDTENWLPVKGYNFFPILNYFESYIVHLEQTLEQVRNQEDVYFITETDVYFSISSCILAIQNAHASYVHALGQNNSSVDSWLRVREGTNISLHEGQDIHLYKVMADSRTEQNFGYPGGYLILSPLEDVNGELVLHSAKKYACKYYFNVNDTLSIL